MKQKVVCRQVTDATGLPTRLPKRAMRHPLLCGFVAIHHAVDGGMYWLRVIAVHEKAEDEVKMLTAPTLLTLPCVHYLVLCFITVQGIRRSDHTIASEFEPQANIYYGTRVQV